jgi:coenzyme PQQ synthesis protein D (PqqD)
VTTVPLDATIALGEGQLTAVMDDGVIVLSMGSGMYYSLDAVASRIWELLQTPSSPRAITETITREFDVDEETATEDVLGFVTELHDNGFVTVSEHA